MPPCSNPNTPADLVNFLTILVPRLISVAKDEPTGFICMIRFISVARREPVEFLCMVRQVYTGSVHMASQVYHGQSFLMGGIRFISVARREPVGFLCMVRQVYTGPVHMASQVHHGQSFLIGGRRTSVRQQVEIRPHTAVSRSKRSF